MTDGEKEVTGTLDADRGKGHRMKTRSWRGIRGKQFQEEQQHNNKKNLPSRRVPREHDDDGLIENFSAPCLLPVIFGPSSS
jgi:hypothetical protein